MGFFIMKPEHRGKGIGRKLWYERRDTLLERLKPGASIGMDGVLAMQPFYAEGGFKIAFRDERHKTIGKAFDAHLNISVISEPDLPEVLAYDEQCFGSERERFLKAWWNMPDLRAFKFKEGDELKGFAMVRRTTKGHKFCPLFADAPDVAEALFQACSNACVGQDLFLDIPMANPHAVNLMERYNSQYVFECARMYYGEAPDLPVEKIYGITSFELG